MKSNLFGLLCKGSVIAWTLFCIYGFFKQVAGYVNMPNQDTAATLTGLTVVSWIAVWMVAIVPMTLLYFGFGKEKG